MRPEQKDPWYLESQFFRAHRIKDTPNMKETTFIIIISYLNLDFFDLKVKKSIFSILGIFQTS